MGQLTSNLQIRMNSLVFLASLVVSSSCLSVQKTGDLKAASPLTNCGCQCSSLTFVDSQGHVQGNCRSVDGTGAQWCYIDPDHGTSCSDLTTSARFPANPWSYEASAAYVAHPAPTVVVSTPTDPHHIHVNAPQV